MINGKILERLRFDVMGLGKILNTKIVLWTITACLSLCSPALSRTYTAVCENIGGVRVDETGSGAELDKDEVKGGTWTFRWSDENNQVQMIMQNSRGAGGAQFTQPGVRITNEAGNVTFVSLPDGAVWVYTLYPHEGDNLLVTQHTTTTKGDRLSGKMMTGQCRGGL